jgi:hypothetical protein
MCGTLEVDCPSAGTSRRSVNRRAIDARRIRLSPAVPSAPLDLAIDNPRNAVASAPARRRKLVPNMVMFIRFNVVATLVIFGRTLCNPEIDVPQPLAWASFEGLLSSAVASGERRNQNCRHNRSLASIAISLKKEGLRGISKGRILKIHLRDDEQGLCTGHRHR